MLGIIGAMNQEVNAVLDILNQQKVYEFYGMKFWEGTINGVKCLVGQSGIGKVNAARCTQIMIDKFNLALVINVGSAGALKPDLEIGDIVISNSCIHFDVDIIVFGHPKGYITGIENRYIQADEALINKCTEVINTTVNPEYKITIGPIGTGDQFITSFQKKDELWKEFGAYCMDMEAAAVAQVCYLCNMPYIVIRSISDKPNKKSEVTFINFLELASSRCAEFLDKLTLKLI